MIRVSFLKHSSSECPEGSVILEYPTTTYKVTNSDGKYYLQENVCMRLGLSSRGFNSISEIEKILSRLDIFSGRRFSVDSNTGDSIIINDIVVSSNWSMNIFTHKYSMTGDVCSYLGFQRYIWYDSFEDMVETIRSLDGVVVSVEEI